MLRIVMVVFAFYSTIPSGVAIRLQPQQRSMSEQGAVAKGAAKSGTAAESGTAKEPAESVVMNVRLDMEIPLENTDGSSEWAETVVKNMRMSDEGRHDFYKINSPYWSPEGLTTIQGESALRFGIPAPTESCNYRFWHTAEVPCCGQIGGFMYYHGDFEEALRFKKPSTQVLVLAQDGTNHTHDDKPRILGANMVTLSTKFEIDSSVAANMLRVPAGDWHYVKSTRDWPRSSDESRIRANLMRLNMFWAWASEKKLPEGRLSDVFGLPVQNYMWLPGGVSGDFVRNKEDAARCNAYGAFMVTFEGGSKTWLYCMAWRKQLEDPPFPCNGLMPESTMKFIAQEYIEASGAIKAFPDLISDNQTTSSMMLLLGGSGAGKSTLIRRLSKCSDAKVDKWVLSGLDEFLDWIPEYMESVKDPYVGYTKAADDCYWPEAIGIAKEVNKKCTDLNIPLILEDTGKNQKFSLDIVKSLGKGRHVTVAMVDNLPEKAVERALGRFQLSGRYSPADYIRESFVPVWETFNAIETAYLTGSIPATKMSFIYCDNSRNFDSRCWLKSGAVSDDLWSEECFSDGHMSRPT